LFFKEGPTNFISFTFLSYQGPKNYIKDRNQSDLRRS